MRTIYLFILFILISIPSAALAQQDWEMDMLISSEGSKNTLTFGQKYGATELADKDFDISKKTEDDFNAYLSIKGTPHSRDIRGTCSGSCVQHWSLIVDGGKTPRAVELHWDPMNLPRNMAVVLIHEKSGKEFDLLSMFALKFQSVGETLFSIEVRKGLF